MPFPPEPKPLSLTSVHSNNSFDESLCPSPAYKAELFPFSIVWTPLPGITWFLPFVGHMGICTSDGKCFDFLGNKFINTQGLGFGHVVRYVKINPSKDYFQNLISAQTSIVHDSNVQHAFQHYSNQNYNFFTNNCHSFVACSLNHGAYKNSTKWNMVKLGALVFFKGKYVNKWRFIEHWLPFLIFCAILYYFLTV